MAGVGKYEDSGHSVIEQEIYFQEAIGNNNGLDLLILVYVTIAIKHCNSCRLV